MATVVQTDFAWPDVEVEREVIEGAGHRLVTGSATPGSESDITELIARHDPEAILTCWARVSEAAIRVPRRLRIVQRIGVGLDNIAVGAATARGAWVANVPDYCVDEVSDHAIALLLDWARGTVAFDRQVKRGLWDPASARLRRVSELVVGVVGYGRIGQSTCRKLRAFGCRLVISDPSAKDPVDGELVGLETLLGSSDVIILHAPLNASTRHMIGDAQLRLVKHGAFLINVSRGPLVENASLLDALGRGQLSGAGLDVIDGEPDVPRELVDRGDVIVTPHVAFSSDASLVELRRRSAQEVVRVLAGARPQFPCNQPIGMT